MSGAILKSWPSLGIREKWIENGWTEAEMNSRAYAYAAEHELDMLCILDPFYMNFLQEYGSNDRVYYRWIAVKNLWTPGQTINIAFTSSSPADMSAYVKQAVMTHLQPHVSMKIVFVESTGSKADVTVDIKKMAAGGGQSSLGKSNSGTGHVTLNTDRFTNVAGDLSKLNEPAHAFKDGGFILTRYLILHEFGHMLGLDHEWLRQNCGGTTTCSATTDPFSVMNYFNQGTTGVQGVVVSTSTMDAYSPGDIEWMQRVYKGDGNVSGTVAPSSNPIIVTPSRSISAQPFKTVGQSSFPSPVDQSSPSPSPVDQSSLSPSLLPTLSTPAPPKRLSTLFIVIIVLSSIVGVGIMIPLLFLMFRGRRPEGAK